MWPIDIIIAYKGYSFFEKTPLGAAKLWPLTNDFLRTAPTYPHQPDICVNGSLINRVCLINRMYFWSQILLHCLVNPVFKANPMFSPRHTNVGLVLVKGPTFLGPF